MNTPSPSLFHQGMPPHKSIPLALESLGNRAAVIRISKKRGRNQEEIQKDFRSNHKTYPQFPQNSQRERKKGPKKERENTAATALNQKNLKTCPTPPLSFLASFPWPPTAIGIYIGIADNPFGIGQRQQDQPKQVTPAPKQETAPEKEESQPKPGKEEAQPKKEIVPETATMTQADYEKVATTGDVEAVKAYIRKFYRILNEGDLSGFAPHFTNFVEGVSNREPGKHFGSEARPVEAMVRELNGFRWAKRIEKDAPQVEKQEEAPAKVAVPKVEAQSAIELATSVPVKGISFDELANSYEKVAETGNVQAVKTFIRRIADIKNEGGLSGFAPHYTKFVEGVSIPEPGKHYGDFPRPTSLLIRELEESSWAKVHPDTPRSEMRNRLWKSILLSGVGVAIVGAGIFVGSLFKSDRVAGPQKQAPVVIVDQTEERVPVQALAKPAPTAEAPTETQKTSTPVRAPPSPATQAIDQRVQYQPSAETVKVIGEGIAKIADKYAVEGVGVHAIGAPLDHIAIDIRGNIVEIGDYGAPSKDGVYLPALLQILDKNSLTSGITTSREDALRRMLKDLQSLREFQIRGEGTEVYGGLFPWNSYQSSGRKITDYAGRKMVPTLDNSQTTFGGLAALAGALWDAQPGTLERQVRDLAIEIIDNQDYGKYVSKQGYLVDEYVFGEGFRGGSRPHLLSTEWAIGDLYAYLTGNLSRDAWSKLDHETFVWESPVGPLDMLKFYIASAHEAWIVQYFMPQIAKSELYPLYLNFAYVHAQHAIDNDMAGFAATEYRQPGNYVPSGPNLKGYRLMDSPGSLRPKMATPYGTALVSLIHPPLMEWLAYLFQQPGVMTAYGPVTAFDREVGGSRVFTADNSFSTLNSIGESRSGIVNAGILRFLKEKHRITEQDVTEAFNVHARDIKKQLGREFLVVGPAKIPGPPAKKNFSIEKAAAKVLPGQNVNIMERLPRTGWFIGRMAQPTIKGNEFQTSFNIKPADDQYAYAGVGLNKALPVSIQIPNGKTESFRSVSLWVPIDLDAYWEMETKNGGQEIAARVLVNTKDEGDLSQDGKWKRLVYAYSPEDAATEADFNTFAVSVPDPRRNRASGTIHFKDLQFHAADPREIKKNLPTGPRSESRTVEAVVAAINQTLIDQRYGTSEEDLKLIARKESGTLLTISVFHTTSRAESAVRSHTVHIDYPRDLARALENLYSQVSPRAEVRSIDLTAPQVILPANIIPGDIRIYLSQHGSADVIQGNPREAGALASLMIPFAAGTTMNRRQALVAGGLGAGAIATQVSTSVLEAQEKQAPTLQQQFRATYEGMSALVDPTWGVAVDKATIVRGGKIQLMANNVDYMKTSPTNMGLDLVSVVIARENGWINPSVAVREAARKIATLEAMQKMNGFWFNWYDLRTNKNPRGPQVTLNQFVSSVDNGNLTASLMVAREAFDGTPLANRIQKLLDDQDYSLFYNPQVGLINHGYDAAKNSKSPYDYGTFNTEARLTSFIAVLNGVDQRAWDGMSREVLTDQSGAIRVVASWGGSLFESLFADVFMGAPHVIGENNKDMVQIHFNKARELKLRVFGWSPSLNAGGTYAEAGVPEVGLRDRGQGYPVGAVSTYSMLLAAEYNLAVVTASLNNMRTLNPAAYNPNYGYVDAIDPRTGQAPVDVLSLDKGMEFAGYDRLKLKTAEKYFWQYLKRVGKAERAKVLLDAEKEKFKDAENGQAKPEKSATKKTSKKLSPEEQAENTTLDRTGYAQVAKTGDVNAVKIFLRRMYNITNEGWLSGFAPHFTHFVPGVSNPEPGKHRGSNIRWDDLLREVRDAGISRRSEARISLTKLRSLVKEKLGPIYGEKRVNVSVVQGSSDDPIIIDLKIAKLDVSSTELRAAGLIFAANGYREIARNSVNPVKREEKIIGYAFRMQKNEEILTKVKVGSGVVAVLILIAAVIGTGYAVFRGPAEKRPADVLPIPIIVEKTKTETSETKPVPLQPKAFVVNWAAEFIKAQENKDAMMKFVPLYLEKVRNRKIQDPGWLIGFSGWYVKPDAPGSEAAVIGIRPFEEFETEMNERIPEWTAANSLGVIQPKQKVNWAEEFTKAQENKDVMMKFVPLYLEKVRNRKIQDPGWLVGFSGWYVKPGGPGAEADVTVLRPFTEFEGEMNERIGEWTAAKSLGVINPKNEQTKSAVVSSITVSAKELENPGIIHLFKEWKAVPERAVTAQGMVSTTKEGNVAALGTYAFTGNGQVKFEGILPAINLSELEVKAVRITFGTQEQAANATQYNERPIQFSPENFRVKLIFLKDGQESYVEKKASEGVPAGGTIKPGATLEFPVTASLEGQSLAGFALIFEHTTGKVYPTDAVVGKNNTTGNFIITSLRIITEPRSETRGIPQWLIKGEKIILRAKAGTTTTIQLDTVEQFEKVELRISETPGGVPRKETVKQGDSIALGENISIAFARRYRDMYRWVAVLEFTVPSDVSIDYEGSEGRDPQYAGFNKGLIEKRRAEARVSKGIAAWIAAGALTAATIAGISIVGPREVLNRIGVTRPEAPEAEKLPEVSEPAKPAESLQPAGIFQVDLPDVYQPIFEEDDVFYSGGFYRNFDTDPRNHSRYTDFAGIQGLYDILGSKLSQLEAAEQIPYLVKYFALDVSDNYSPALRTDSAEAVKTLSEKYPSGSSAIVDFFWRWQVRQLLHDLGRTVDEPTLERYVEIVKEASTLNALFRLPEFADAEKTLVKLGREVSGRAVPLLLEGADLSKKEEQLALVQRLGTEGTENAKAKLLILFDNILRETQEQEEPRDLNVQHRWALGRETAKALSPYSKDPLVVDRLIDSLEIAPIYASDALTEMAKTDDRVLKALTNALESRFEFKREAATRILNDLMNSESNPERKKQISEALSKSKPRSEARAKRQHYRANFMAHATPQINIPQLLADLKLESRSEIVSGGRKNVTSGAFGESLRQNYSQWAAVEEVLNVVQDFQLIGELLADSDVDEEIKALINRMHKRVGYEFLDDLGDIMALVGGFSQNKVSKNSPRIKNPDDFKFLATLRARILAIPLNDIMDKLNIDYAGRDAVPEEYHYVYFRWGQLDSFYSDELGGAGIILPLTAFIENQGSAIEYRHTAVDINRSAYNNALAKEWEFTAPGGMNLREAIFLVLDLHSDRADRSREWLAGKLRPLLNDESQVQDRLKRTIILSSDVAANLEDAFNYLTENPHGKKILAAAQRTLKRLNRPSRAEARGKNPFLDLKKQGELDVRDVKGLVVRINGLIQQGRRLLKENKGLSLSDQVAIENDENGLLERYRRDIETGLREYSSRRIAEEVLGAWAEAHEDRDQLLGLQHIENGVAMLESLKRVLTRPEARGKRAAVFEENILVAINRLNQFLMKVGGDELRGIQGNVAGTSAPVPNELRQALVRSLEINPVDYQTAAIIFLKYLESINAQWEKLDSRVERWQFIDVHFNTTLVEMLQKLEAVIFKRFKELKIDGQGLNMDDRTDLNIIQIALHPPQIFSSVNNALEPIFLARLYMGQGLDKLKTRFSEEEMSKLSIDADLGINPLEIIAQIAPTEQIALWATDRLEFWDEMENKDLRWSEQMFGETRPSLENSTHPFEMLNKKLKKMLPTDESVPDRLPEDLINAVERVIGLDADRYVIEDKIATAPGEVAGESISMPILLYYFFEGVNEEEWGYAALALTWLIGQQSIPISDYSDVDYVQINKKFIVTPMVKAAKQFIQTLMDNNSEKKFLAKQIIRLMVEPLYAYSTNGIKYAAGMSAALPEEFPLAIANSTATEIKTIQSKENFSDLAIDFKEIKDFVGENGYPESVISAFDSALKSIADEIKSRAEARKMTPELEAMYRLVVDVVEAPDTFERSELRKVSSFVTSEVKRISLADFAETFKTRALTVLRLKVSSEREKGVSIDEFMVQAIEEVMNRWVTLVKNRQKDSLPLLAVDIRQEDGRLTVEGLIDSLLAASGQMSTVIFSGDTKEIGPYQSRLNKAQMDFTTIGNLNTVSEERIEPFKFLAVVRKSAASQDGTSPIQLNVGVNPGDIVGEEWNSVLEKGESGLQVILGLLLTISADRLDQLQDKIFQGRLLRDLFEGKINGEPLKFEIKQDEEGRLRISVNVERPLLLQYLQKIADQLRARAEIRQAA